MRGFTGLALACFAAASAAQAADCTGVSTASNTTLNAVTVASGLTQRPLFVTSSPGDTSRIFIVEQNGYIRIKNKGDGANVWSTYLDIDARVDSSSDEMGLLGLAFDPDFATSGYFYVNYTETPGSRYSVIARFHALDATHGDPNSELRLMRYIQPEINHNGGWMTFGPDGYLYIATGDGGGSGDLHGTCGNGQSLTTLLGKVLRIDPRGIAPTSRAPDCGLGGQGYVIPQDNPFDDGPGGNCDEVYAYGLRNPWRPSFDSGTGDLYVADVGQGCWEEINYVERPGNGGYNFGWRQMEGTHCYNAAQGCFASSSAGCSPACNDPSLTDPILDYSNSGASECAITGGYVYRGCRMPNLQGKYFYSDYCTRFIRSITVVNGTIQGLPTTWSGLDPGGSPGGLTSYGEDAQGELYLTYRNGLVRKFVPPMDALELSAPAAGAPFLLDKTGAWTWENLTAASDIPVSFYRVYRGVPNGEFTCVLKTPTSSWPAGGDPAIPAPETFFAYLVTAMQSAPLLETKTGHPGTFDASTCP
ncbi:MAG TPA: PQQ-dependent sugar dehydrogenase [Candidatus Polarisedimenticolaceae bacterium]|nr:PQQ-dependent sugar dehydrogenase [Candidatus Polarisedimenticolaceae bacterium]